VYIFKARLSTFFLGSVDVIVSLSLVQWMCDCVSLSCTMYSKGVIMSLSLVQWRCECVSVSCKVEV
jgi:hypothetical protein